MVIETIVNALPIVTKKSKTATKSKRFSFKGYSFWLSTKDALKELLRTGIPLIIAVVETKNPAYVAIATVAGRYLITAFEYFYKEYN